MPLKGWGSYEEADGGRDFPDLDLPRLPTGNSSVRCSWEVRTLVQDGSRFAAPGITAGVQLPAPDGPVGDREAARR